MNFDSSCHPVQAGPLLQDTTTTTTTKNIKNNTILNCVLRLNYVLQVYHTDTGIGVSV